MIYYLHIMFGPNGVFVCWQNVYFLLSFSPRRGWPRHLQKLQPCKVGGVPSVRLKMLVIKMTFVFVKHFRIWFWRSLSPQLSLNVKGESQAECKSKRFPPHFAAEGSATTSLTQSKGNIRECDVCRLWSKCDNIKY